MAVSSFLRTPWYPSPVWSSLASIFLFFFLLFFSSVAGVAVLSAVLGASRGFAFAGVLGSSLALSLASPAELSIPGFSPGPPRHTGGSLRTSAKRVGGFASGFSMISSESGSWDTSFSSWLLFTSDFLLWRCFHFGYAEGCSHVHTSP